MMGKCGYIKSRNHPLIGVLGARIVGGGKSLATLDLFKVPFSIIHYFSILVLIFPFCVFLKGGIFLHELRKLVHLIFPAGRTANEVVPPVIIVDFFGC